MKNFWGKFININKIINLMWRKSVICVTTPQMAKTKLVNYSLTMSCWQIIWHFTVSHKLTSYRVDRRQYREYRGESTKHDWLLFDVADDLSDGSLHLDLHWTHVRASAARATGATLKLTTHTNHLLDTQTHNMRQLQLELTTHTDHLLDTQTHNTCQLQNSHFNL